MRTVTMQYCKCGIRHRLVRMAPVSWSELSPEQFILVARLYLQKIDPEQFLKDFFKIPVRRLDEYQLYTLSQLTDFISDCRTQMDKFIIPVIGDLQAPVIRLKGMTFEHFMQIDTAFNRYAQTEKPEYLDRFIAILYLKKGESIVLSPNYRKGLFSHQKVLNMNKRMQEVSKIDRSVKYAVFLNYLFIKRWLAKSFPWLFPLAEGEDKPQEKKKPSAPSVNWLDIFDAFVGDNVAEMDKFQQMPATTAFRLLNKKIRDAKVKKK